MVVEPLCFVELNILPSSVIAHGKWMLFNGNQMNILMETQLAYKARE